MRPYIDRAWYARLKIHRTHMIEEYERADHAMFRVRQHPADFESAQIAAPLLNDELDHTAMTNRA